MKFYKMRIYVAQFFLMTVLLSSCTQSNSVKNELKPKPISNSEIIAFQKAYGVSFNAISEAIKSNGYYEAAAQEHISKNYDFSTGKVLFKIGHSDDDPYRYTKKGILSYLIGKNSEYPNDTGIAKENWRKMEWKNDGIVQEDNGLAVVMGKVKMIKDDGDEINHNYTMCLKRNDHGKLKLIAHKIARPCD